MVIDSSNKTVQPVPAPFSTNALNNNKINEGGSSQKLMLLSLGNAINNVNNSRRADRSHPLPLSPAKRRCAMHRLY